MDTMCYYLDILTWASNPITDLQKIQTNKSSELDDSRRYSSYSTQQTIHGFSKKLINKTLS